jgi:hypothetical protein
MAHVAAFDQMTTMTELDAVGISDVRQIAQAAGPAHVMRFLYTDFTICTIRYMVDILFLKWTFLTKNFS